MAYAARYGNQPIPVIMSMTRSSLRHFNRALGRIVRRENEE